MKARFQMDNLLPNMKIWLAEKRFYWNDVIIVETYVGRDQKTGTMLNEEKYIEKCLLFQKLQWFSICWTFSNHPHISTFHLKGIIPQEQIFFKILSKANFNLSTII